MRWDLSVKDRWWVVVAAAIVLALPLSGCTGIGQRYSPLPVGTCVRVSAEGNETVVSCAEPHTHMVIAIVDEGEACPPETNMEAAPADPDDGLMTTCYAPDAAGEATPTPEASMLASASAPAPSTPAASTPPASATLLPTLRASASPRPSATPMPLITGWPTVRRSGVTMTGGADVAPPPFQGCCGAGPALVLSVTLTGLAPGEAVSLPGTASYDFGMLGCGVQPSPCECGSDTTDPAVQLCRPEYSGAVKGTAGALATGTADAQGTATATLRFVMPESERACPAGDSRPWYTWSGRWTALVTDTAHELRLVLPPDIVIIGP